MACRNVVLPAAIVCLCLSAYSRASGPTIEQAWDELLSQPDQRASKDLLDSTKSTHPPRNAAQEFVNHFFFNTRSEYIRQEVAFTGLPTVTGVVDGEPGPVADPGAIPFSGAFQPNSDHLYSSMNWGTQGWLSSRVNTNFALRYRQDLSAVSLGSPSQSIVNTFPSNRLFELATGVVEVQGLTRQGRLADSTLRLGRQHIFGAESASLDGFSLTLKRPRFQIGLFGGRRFTYYSDPEQWAIGGGSFGVRLPRGASFEYQGFFYVRGSHRFIIRQSLEPNWRARAQFKMIGSKAVEVGAQLNYLPVNGLTAARFTFGQKLSSHDFIYDYTSLGRDRDPFNRFSRLNLGTISPHHQFSIDASRQLIPSARLGGAIWIRRLNDESDAGPFDASFEDYRTHLRLFPLPRLALLLEFHHRETDRPSPLEADQFDDVRSAGETRVQDISAEVSRSFGEDRIGITAGVYHRDMALRNRFFFIDGARVLGALAGVYFQLDPRTRLHFRYGLDDDFFIFRPSLQRSQAYRLGLAWKF